MSRAPSGLAGALCKVGRAFRQVGRFHRPEQTRPGEFGRAHAPRRTPAAKLPRAPKSVRRTVCRDSGGPAATLAVPWRARSAALAGLSDSESALGKTAARGVPSHANGSARPAHSRSRGWGAAQSPHSAPPSPSRCSPQSTSRLGPPRQFRDSVPIARASIPASAFRVLWVLGAGVCRHYRVQRRSPSSPGGIRGGLLAFQNLRPLASAPVLVCRR